MTHLQQLRALAATTRAIATSQDAAALAQLVVEQAATFAASEVALLLVGYPPASPRIAASVGLAAATVEALSLPLDHPTPDELRRLLSVAPSDWFHCLPLAHGELQGWLVVHQLQKSARRSPAGIQAETVRLLLSTLADQAAAALEQLLRQEAAAQARIKAADAEAQFRSLLEAAPDALIIIGRDQRILLVNAQAETLFGYRRGELIGEPVETLLPERMHGRHSGHLTRYFADPQVRPMGAGLELYARHQDGNEIPVEISLSPLEANGGLLIISSIRDVSERKRALDALRASEERFHTAFEHSPLAMALVDLEGRYLQVNRALCAFVGYSEAELLARTCFGITDPEDLPADREGVQQLLAGTIPSFELEKRYRSKQGETLWGQVSVCLVRDGEGRPLHYLRQIRDVTEQRRTEEALRHSEALYRTLSELLPDFVWTYRADGQPGYRNQRWKEYTGRSGTDAQEVDDTIHPEDAPQVRALWARAFARGEPYEAEVRIRRYDGEYRWFLNRADPLPAGEAGTTEWVGSSTDITERKEVEETLRQQAATLSEQLRLLHLAHDAILVRDQEDRIQFWNQGAEQTYGYSREDAVGQVVHHLLQTRCPVSLEAVQTALRRDGFWEGELVHTTREGSVVTVASRQVLQRDEADAPDQVLEINRDITARKRLETERDALLARERHTGTQLRTVLEALPVGVWFTDAAGKIILGNPAGQRIWGGARYVPPEGYSEYRGWWYESGKPIAADEWALARALAKGETSLNELLEIEGFDGVRRIIHNSAVPVYGEEGRITGAVVINEEITERKRADEALRATEQFSHGVLNSLAGPLAVLDEQGEIVRVNTAWEQFAAENGGEPAKTGVGVNYLEICRTAAGPQAAGAKEAYVGLQAVLSGSLPAFEMEYSCPAPHEERWFLLRAMPLRERGGALIVSHVDVTLLKRAEQALLEAERARSEQLGLAIREAHHRIKNNLQAVTDLLSLELGAAASAGGGGPLRDSIERIQAISLVHDLLTHDREMEWVDVGELAARLVPSVLQANTRVAAVDLALAVPSRSVSSKQATALALILNELVSNAAKHAFRGRPSGRLEVELVEEQQLLLVVQDDGPGLPEGFDLGRHSHIGLQVTRALVESNLRGSLCFHSRKGLRAEVRFDPREGVSAS